MALAAGGILTLAALLLLGRQQRGRAERRRHLEQEGAARAQAEGRRAAEEGRREREARDLGRVRGPPSHVGELLAALARATPPDILLREVTCREDEFILRGRVEAADEAVGNLLLRFHRELCPPGAPWQIPEPASGPADFAWHGLFARPSPEAGDLEPALAAARAALRPPAAFEAWLRRWSSRWRILALSSERGPGVELRHCALACAPAPLGAWSEIVQTLQAIDAQPGLSVDSLILVAAPEGADAFLQAQLTLTARLRPGS
jgi:hypothetical protein